MPKLRKDIQHGTCNQRFSYSELDTKVEYPTVDEVEAIRGSESGQDEVCIAFFWRYAKWSQDIAIELARGYGVDDIRLHECVDFAYDRLWKKFWEVARSFEIREKEKIGEDFLNRLRGYLSYSTQTWVSRNKLRRTESLPDEEEPRYNEIICSIDPYATEEQDRLIEQREIFEKILPELPQKYVRLLSLKLYEGLDNAEIARRTGYTIANVRQILSRAIRKMRNIAYAKGHIQKFSQRNKRLRGRDG